MTATYEIYYDREQADGRHLVKVRTTHVESGEVKKWSPFRVKVTSPATAAAEVALVAQAKADLHQSNFELYELDKAHRAVVDEGADPETYALYHTSRNQLRSYLAKNLFNSMKRRDTDPEALRRIRAAVGHLGKYTDAQIASLVGWTEQEVAAARAKLLSFKNATDSIDHGKPEFEL